MTWRDKTGRAAAKGSLSSFLALDAPASSNSLAWKSLTAVQRCCYIEVARVYNGSNNGRLAMSGRRLAALLHVGESSGTRALKVLVERGLLEVATPSAFSRKTRMATEYRLTAYRCDFDGQSAFEELDEVAEVARKRNTGVIKEAHYGLGANPLANLLQDDCRMWASYDAVEVQMTVSTASPEGPIYISAIWVTL